MIQVLELIYKILTDKSCRLRCKLENTYQYSDYSIYSTCKTYIEWQANPTITTINTTAYSIKNIEFPSITICSQGAAKDVVDTVLLKQFETYLNSRGIKASNISTNLSNSTSKRQKRSATFISHTLSKAEVFYMLSLSKQT